jgi:hypothetical protein
VTVRLPKSAPRCANKHCKTKFRPKRADAKFCSPLCRDAASWLRKKDMAAAEVKAVAEAMFEQKQQRRQQGLKAIDEFARLQSLAGLLHLQARSAGAGVKVMATKIGILAVEAQPDALLALGGFAHLLFHRRLRVRSDDHELRALLSLPSCGGPCHAQEAERECRAALDRGPAEVSLFLEDRSPQHAAQWHRFVTGNRRGETAESRNVAHDKQHIEESPSEWITDGFEIVSRAGWADLDTPYIRRGIHAPGAQPNRLGMPPGRFLYGNSNGQRRERSRRPAYVALATAAGGQELLDDANDILLQAWCITV